jgi:hypothetical protein
MKNLSIKTWQSFVIGLLILNIAIFGCATTAMWESKPTHEAPDVLYRNVNSPKLVIMVLSNDQIAVLPSKNGNNQFDDMATIYKFNQSTYESIKPKIQSVVIGESIYLSFEDKNVMKNSRYTFEVKMTDNTTITPEFVNTTLTKRSDKEIAFDDNRINFSRVIYGNKNQTDMSWLWKVPLTPITLAVDAVGTAIGVVSVGAMVVIATPFILVGQLDKTIEHK